MVRMHATNKDECVQHTTLSYRTSAACDGQFARLPVAIRPLLVVPDAWVCLQCRDRCRLVAFWCNGSNAIRRHCKINACINKWTFDEQENIQNKTKQKPTPHTSAGIEASWCWHMVLRRWQNIVSERRLVGFRRQHTIAVLQTCFQLLNDNNYECVMSDLSDCQRAVIPVLPAHHSWGGLWPPWAATPRSLVEPLETCLFRRVIRMRQKIIVGLASYDNIAAYRPLVSRISA